VVEGSVGKAGGRVRIPVQLNDVLTASRVRAEVTTAPSPTKRLIFL
jgi:TolB-like protein